MDHDYQVYVAEAADLSARARVRLALRAIEDDARLYDLTDAEVDSIIAAAAPPSPAGSDGWREALALQAIKAVTATCKDGAIGLSRIMAITRSAGVEAPYSDLLQDDRVRLIVERPRAEWRHLLEAPCDIPPTGWHCTRKAGHDGPCAAAPTPPVAPRG